MSLECTPSSPCRLDGCAFCDPAGYLAAREFGSELLDTWPEHPAAPEEPLYGDVAALLAGGVPPPPTPALLRREDGRKLFYAGKVNVLFGDPECGKTWIALAAVAEALNSGRKAVFVDLDHNGMAEIVSRLLLLGAKPEDLGNPDKFRYAEPEDKDILIITVADLRRWRPAVAVIDSVGELLPMFGGSSNSPDDYTDVNRRVMTPLAIAGAAVIIIDHLPKDDAARDKGQTGTLAKRRTVNGITLRVTVSAGFAPGRGGSANMTITKDRPGGVRAHCPPGKPQPAGRFEMTTGEAGVITWRVTTPRSGDGAPVVLVPAADLAALDRMESPPRTKRQVEETLGWGSNRAQNALKLWRELRKESD